MWDHLKQAYGKDLKENRYCSRSYGQFHQTSYAYFDKILSDRLCSNAGVEDSHNDVELAS